jgi:hypothetical protein
VRFCRTPCSGHLRTAYWPVHALLWQVLSFSWTWCADAVSYWPLHDLVADAKDGDLTSAVVRGFTWREEEPLCFEGTAVLEEHFVLVDQEQM